MVVAWVVRWNEPLVAVHDGGFAPVDVAAMTRSEQFVCAARCASASERDAEPSSCRDTFVREPDDLFRGGFTQRLDVRKRPRLAHFSCHSERASASRGIAVLRFPVLSSLFPLPSIPDSRFPSLFVARSSTSAH